MLTYFNYQKDFQDALPIVHGGTHSRSAAENVSNDTPHLFEYCKQYKMYCSVCKLKE